MPRSVRYHTPSYRTSLAHASTVIRATEELLECSRTLLCARDDPGARQQAGQSLLDGLNAHAGIPPCLLVLADIPQSHSIRENKLVRKTYGYYRSVVSGKTVARARIRIYHQTAVRHQPIALTVFIDTLLHEWNHHYDFAKLHLVKSYHTAGFYQRIAQVKGELRLSRETAVDVPLPLV